MKKSSSLLPWFIAAATAWSLGFVYNVFYGGELSWLRRMYQQKVVLAAEIKSPQRLIIVGGSGAHHAHDSLAIEQGLGIPVMNLGLDGPVGLNVILPSVLAVIRPGDIVLFVPEDLILLDDDGLLSRSVSFGLATGRPGVGDVPLKQLAQETWMLGVPTLKALTKSTLDLLEKGRMTGYYSEPISQRGDPTVVKYRKGKWWKWTINKSISPHAIARIQQFRQEVEAKGGTLVLSLPWVYASTEKETVKNMRKTADELKKIAPLVAYDDLYNLKSDSQLFADTHHHLVPQARKQRAAQLVEGLTPVITD